VKKSRILALLFVTVYIVCNLARFYKSLAEYTVHNLVTLPGLAYRIGVVEQGCQMMSYYTIFYKNGISLDAFVAEKLFATPSKT